jgi:transmembrane sensor
MKNNTDKIFKDKIDQFEQLPCDIKWNRETGWNDYVRTYGYQKSFATRKIIRITSTVAAAFILTFFIYRSISLNADQYDVYTNIQNKVKRIDFPDGNSIWLNKNTTIQYTKDLKAKNCTLIISGEAYLEINKLNCEKYILETGNALVQFSNPIEINIRSYDYEADVQITVKKGVAKVQEKSDEEGLAVLVNQDHFCSVHKSASLVFSTQNQNQNYLSWKTGKFVFDNTPVITVANVLSEYYGKQIKLKDEKAAFCLLSYSFENQSLDEILNEIKAQLNLDIINAGNKIILSGDGC